MIELERPESRAIGYLSPTSYEVGQACPLRLAFRQASPGRGGKRTPALRLGDACHHVLDRLVRHWLDKERTDWDAIVAQLWTEEIKQEAADSERAGEFPLYGPPERWSAYQLKRVRLVRVARRLLSILDELPAEAKIHPEHELVAFDGKLRGRIDLFIEHPASHRLIDYKSGTAIDRQTLDVRVSYAHQLQLYAVLVWQNFGEWPVSAQLIPLEGPPVNIALEENSCRAIAEAAQRLFDDFNVSVPVAPAYPGVSNCPVCSYSARCSVLWAELDTSWAQDLLAVRGTVSKVTRTPLGGTSILVDMTDGSMEGPTVVIRNIDEIAHPDSVRAELGRELVAMGLQSEPDQGSHRLGPTGILRIG